MDKSQIWNGFKNFDWLIFLNEPNTVNAQLMHFRLGFLSSKSFLNKALFLKFYFLNEKTTVKRFTFCGRVEKDSFQKPHLLSFFFFVESHLCWI